MLPKFRVWMGACLILCLVSISGAIKRRHDGLGIHALKKDPFKGWEGEFHGSCTKFAHQPTEDSVVCTDEPMSYPFHVKLWKQDGEWHGDSWWYKAVMWDDKGQQYNHYNGSMPNFKAELEWTDSLGHCVRITSSDNKTHLYSRSRKMKFGKDVVFIKEWRWNLKPVLTDSGSYELAACPPKDQYVTLECSTKHNYFGTRCLIYKRGRPSD